MKIELQNKIGTATKQKAAVKAWKKNPSDFTSACVAARYYAEKENEEMAVIPHNSYGRKVFQIAFLNDDLKKYTVVSTSRSVAVVYPNGDVFQAVAS